MVCGTPCVYAIGFAFTLCTKWLKSRVLAGRKMPIKISMVINSLMRKRSVFFHHSYLHSPLDTWFQRGRFRQEVNCVSRTVYTLSDPRLRRIQSIRTSSAVRNGNACNYEQTYATNVEYLDQVAFHGPSRYNLCTGIRLTVHTPSAASGHHRQMNLIITFKFEKLVLHFILCRFIFMWLSHGLVSKHLPISHSSESIDTTTKNPVYAGLRVWL